MSIEIKNLKIKVIISGQQSTANDKIEKWSAKETMEAIQKINKNRKER